MICAAKQPGGNACVRMKSGNGRKKGLVNPNIFLNTLRCELFFCFVFSPKFRERDKQRHHLERFPMTIKKTMRIPAKRKQTERKSDRPGRENQHQRLVHTKLVFLFLLLFDKEKAVGFYFRFLLEKKSIDTRDELQPAADKTKYFTCVNLSPLHHLSDKTRSLFSFLFELLSLFWRQ